MRLLEIIWWSGVGAIFSGTVVSAVAIRKYYKLYEFTLTRVKQMRKYRDELMLLKQTDIRVLEPKPLITPAEDDPEFVEALAEAERLLEEEERAESRNREYERDEFLNGLTNSNWGEDERAEYELGVHLERKRMGEISEPF